MPRRNRFMNRGRLAAVIATAVAVISVASPIAEAAPKGEPGKAAGKRVSPSDLPFLESKPLRQSPPLSAGTPYMGATGAEPVPVAEVESRRSADTRDFRNNDGS
jgi:hypothetical protein